jgi:uncharacterized membrane protein HdeD (DUF308 family)
MSHQFTEHAASTPRARVAPAAAFVAMAGLSGGDLRRVRTWLLATGILSLIGGAVAIAVPAAASVATAIFVGWILVFAGVVLGAHAFSRRSEPGPALRFLNAALTLAIGIYLLVAPLDGTLTLTFMLAAWFFAIGLLELLAAWMARVVPGSGFIAFNGALSVALGLLIAFNLPSSADWAIGLLVGIYLVFWGIRALFLASVLKRAVAA